MKSKKIIIAVMTLFLTFALIPPKQVQAGWIADTYNAFISAGNTIWQWIAGEAKTATGGGGISRGGGAGRDGYYYNGQYQYQQKDDNTYIVDIATGVTSYTRIIDPYDQVLNIPGGVVTEIDREGGGGVTRGGGAGRYPITDITYDPVTNIYNVTVNNIVNEYYTVYAAPTYTAISYEVAGKTVTDRYYFRLPDGRNSWDMKADEIYGQPMIYEYTNYDAIAEDDGTLYLFHFDGQVKDESYNKIQFDYINPTYNYVDSGNFEQAIMWTGNEQLSLKPNYNLGSGDFTQELRIYIPRVNTWVETQTVTNSGQLKDINGAKATSDCNVPWATRTIFNVYGIHIYSRAKLNFSPCSNPTRSITANDNNAYLALEDESVQNVTRSIATDVWHTITRQRKNGVIKIFLNGALIKTINDNRAYGTNVVYSAHQTSSNQARPVSYLLLDELRFSLSALYQDNFVPASTPFTTNNVYVLPQNPTDSLIAIKSDIKVNGVRWGGVKPTYPTRGFTYFMLSDTTVNSIQQFDGSDWIPVDGAIYENEKWNNLNGYKLDVHIIDDGDYPTPTDPPEPVDPPDSTLIEAIVTALGNVISSIFDLGGKMITSLTSLFTTLFVPEQQQISNMFNDLEISFSEKMGFLKTPFDLYQSIMGRYLATQETHEGIQMMTIGTGAIIPIPQVVEPFTGVVLIEPNEINLSTIVETEPITTLYNFYLIFVDALCIVWVVNLARKKYDTITSS